MTDEKVKRVCADCGEKYQLSAGDVEFYSRRGLFLPRRCRDCRTARRLSERPQWSAVPGGAPMTRPRAMGLSPRPLAVVATAQAYERVV